MPVKQLCRLDEVEQGSMKLISVDGTDFLVLRGSEDELLVIPPSCPHMATSLCDGFFDGCVLTCSQHLWQWSVKDGSMQGIAEESLAVYPSREENGVVSIEFQHELKYHHQTEA